MTAGEPYAVAMASTLSRPKSTALYHSHRSEPVFNLEKSIMYSYPAPPMSKSEFLMSKRPFGFLELGACLGFRISDLGFARESFPLPVYSSFTPPAKEGPKVAYFTPPISYTGSRVVTVSLFTPVMLPLFRLAPFISQVESALQAAAPPVETALST